MNDISTYSLDFIGESQNDYSLIRNFYKNPPQVTQSETDRSYTLYTPQDTYFFENIPNTVHSTEKLVSQTSDTDEWIERIQEELQKHEKNQITNGYVSTANTITNTELTFDTITYFNARSSLEKFQFEAIKSKSLPDTTETYLAGITHTLLISPTTSDNTYVMIGRNSQNKTIQSLQYNTAPAGLIEPHHIKPTLTETITEHFCEEAPEELLHNKISFSEFKETLKNKKSNISITPTSVYIDQFSRSLEISTVINITGQLADFILEAMNPNKEYSTVTNYPLDIFGKSSEFPVDITDFTRQSRVSLLLMLCSEYDSWNLNQSETQ